MSLVPGQSATPSATLVTSVARRAWRRWTGTVPRGPIRIDLYVGYSGAGKLNIGTGALVTATGSTYVGFNAGASGEIHFSGGTLTTQSLLASPTQLTGTGTINTHGLVSDIDLVFDVAHGLSQTFTINQSGENVTLNLDLASNPSANGDLARGHQGIGSLTIRDGISLESGTGYLGFSSGSTGVATVDGSGSRWTNSGDLYVGPSGPGNSTSAPALQ